MSKKNKSVPMMDAVPAKPEKDYEAESAFDTMLRAHEHMNDEKMMKRVRKHAGRKLKALKGLTEHVMKSGPRSIDDLKKARDKAMNDNDGDEMDD